MTTDTSAQTQEIYYRRLAEMSPAERLGVGMALWVAGDSMQRAAVRRAHPEADEAELLFQLAVVRFGTNLARRAYGRT